VRRALSSLPTQTSLVQLPFSSTAGIARRVAFSLIGALRLFQMPPRRQLLRLLVLAFSSGITVARGGRGGKGRTDGTATVPVVDRAPPAAIGIGTPVETVRPSAAQTEIGTTCVDGYWCQTAAKCVSHWSECGAAWKALESPAEAAAKDSSGWTFALSSVAIGFVCSSLVGLWLRRRLSGATAQPAPLKGSED